MGDHDWCALASWQSVRVRAQILRQVRDYFYAQGVMEVETPLLSDSATPDPNLHSFVARACEQTGLAIELGYLHTSPEYAMKRLLVQYRHSIYQICKVFRGGEQGARHNPEFTLLEWYRVDWRYHQLMQEVDRLASHLLSSYLVKGLEATEYIRYREAFRLYADIDPMVASVAQFAHCAARHGLSVPSGLEHSDVRAWRDWLLTELIEPHLGNNRLTFLFDFPADQHALANIRQDDPPVAERFELYCEGMELANGFQELTDAVEQRSRFANELARRHKNGLAAVPIDERLLAAMEAGLPTCAGVALGIDRLMMIAMGVAGIDQVITFARARA